MNKEVYEECESCFNKVNIMNMIVKGTEDGNCIYCPKCYEKQKLLYSEIKRIYGVDFDNLSKSDFDKLNKK